MTKDKTIYEDDFFSNEDYFKPFKKALNVKSLDKLNQKQIDKLARILKNVKW